jgi:hypothetical protein
MKKVILGLLAAGVIAAVSVPLTLAAAPAPAHSTGNVTWSITADSGEVITGQVIFNANAKTGGTLDYQNSKGGWLHGVVTPGSYQQTDSNTVQFSGMITDGSWYYQPGAGTFTAVIHDGGSSGTQGDTIAVFANEAPQAGVFANVTGGNLAIH